MNSNKSFMAYYAVARSIVICFEREARGVKVAIVWICSWVSFFYISRSSMKYTAAVTSNSGIILTF